MISNRPERNTFHYFLCFINIIPRGFFGHAQTFSFSERQNFFHFIHAQEFIFGFFIRQDSITISFDFQPRKMVQKLYNQIYRKKRRFTEVTMPRHDTCIARLDVCLLSMVNGVSICMARSQ